LVRLGPGVTARELGPDEREALDAADCALVSSEFMAQVVRGLGFGARPVLCVEPGCELGPRGRLPRAADGVRALVVAHVVSSKGIEPLLVALAAELKPSDRLELRIVGDTRAEPAYAARCQALVAAESALSARVAFCGSLPEASAHDELCRSNLLLSASVMESYGMALSEGRRVGLPLLARDAGNASAHVEVAAGGELVASAEELATACVRLCRDPNEHARRLLAAQAHIRPARAWRAAALELNVALQGLLGS
jgi:glycosyltransferase involved in cell wall biosynthesis